MFLEVETAARTLISNPDNPKALLNIGYFVHVRRVRSPESCRRSGFAYRLKREYGHEFMGDVTPPFYYYKRGLAQFGPDDSSLVEA